METLPVRAVLASYAKHYGAVRGRGATPYLCGVAARPRNYMRNYTSACAQRISRANAEIKYKCKLIYTYLKNQVFVRYELNWANLPAVFYAPNLALPLDFNNQTFVLMGCNGKPGSLKLWVA